MPAPTGAHTTLWYLWEVNGDDTPAFATSETEDDDRKPFGGNAVMTSFEGSNNAVDIFQPNSREMEQLIAQHFEGSVTIDFEWTNPWWLAGVLASPSTESNGDGTYTHTFDGDIPLPMQIVAGYDERAVGSGEDPMYRKLHGVVLQTATIDTSVEDVVSVSLSGAYVDETTERVDSLDSQPSLNHEVKTFAEAMLELDEEKLSLVQDVSLEINNNTDIIREIGTRVGVDYSPKGRVPSVDYTKIREDNSEIQSLYGSEAASAIKETVESEGPMKVEVDNGLTEEDMEQAQFDMDGAFPESVTTENFGNPEEDLQESINKRLTTITAKATNAIEEAR